MNQISLRKDLTNQHPVKQANHSFDQRYLSDWRFRSKVKLARTVFSVFPPKLIFFAMTVGIVVFNRPGLARQFIYDQPEQLHRHLNWFSKTRLGMYCLNQIVHKLIGFTDYKPENTEQFCKSALSQFLHGYPLCFALELSQINWETEETVLHGALIGLIRRMLEHRLYEAEEHMLRIRRTFGQLPSYVSTEQYIPHYYRNKELIQTLSGALNLKNVDQTLAKLDAEGQHWETIPEQVPNQQLVQEILLFDAYRDLTLYSYHNGEGHLTPILCKGMLEVQTRLQQQFMPRPSPELKKLLASLGIKNLADVKLLWPDWSALIGHNGHLNVHLMMRELGWWTGSPILLAWKDRIANPVFLSLFEETCPTLILGENISSELWHELACLIPFIGVSHQVFQFSDGRAMYWNDAGAMALAQWEDENRGFPLRDVYDRRLEIDDSPACTFAVLKTKWGMAPEDWYVCLHMRDAGMRNEKDGAGETIRNATIDSYLDAIRYITNQGGWVIRMGGPKVPPLPEMERVIDYARLPDRSAEMDIHIVRMARMFIGTTSGFAYVASSFGIPTAMVNALTSLGQIWPKNTRFALKPVRTNEGRLLSQSEITSDQWRWAFPTHESLSNAGLVVEENSADEILETVRETLALTDPLAPKVILPWLEKWTQSLSFPGYYGGSQPSAYFIEKYGKDFLP